MRTDHGYSRYSSHGAAACRCDVCKLGARDYRREQRKRALVNPALPHGTRAKYDAGCRCYQCLGARSSAFRRLEKKRPSE